LPPGVDLKAEQAKLVQKISSGNDVVKDATITADDLPKENGETVFDQASTAPSVYTWLVRLPWILGGLAVVSGIALLLLHDERRRGLWVVGRAMFVTGLVLTASVLLVSYLAGQVHPAVDNQNDLVTLVPDIIRSLANQVNHVLLLFGAGYAAVGAGTMLGLHLTRPKTPKPAPAAAETPLAVSEKPKPDELIAPEKP
jgi:hypothetical protein